jgi:DNA-binding response OmpR family regulator
MLPLLRRKERVLLLDDDLAIQRLVATLLKREGFKVDAVDKGLRAIDALQEQEYDAILLDVMMPHEGGITVIRHLRDHNPAMLRKVLLLTGTPESVLKSILRDVAGVVYKPFTREELLAAVRRVAGAE